MIKKKPTYSADLVRDLSEKVYRSGLEDSCAGDVAKMIAKDGDDGSKLRGRAAFYDALTRRYLAALDVPFDQHEAAS